MLDIVIGFAVIMTVLSLFITILVQMVSTGLALRGKNLANALSLTFQTIDPKIGEQAHSLAAQILRDPIFSDSIWRTKSREVDVAGLALNAGNQLTILSSPTHPRSENQYAGGGVERVLSADSAISGTQKMVWGGSAVAGAEKTRNQQKAKDEVLRNSDLYSRGMQIQLPLSLGSDAITCLSTSTIRALVRESFTAIRTVRPPRPTPMAAASRRNSPWVRHS